MSRGDGAGQVEHDAGAVGEAHLLADDVADGALELAECDLGARTAWWGGVVMSRSCTQKSKIRISRTPHRSASRSESTSAGWAFRSASARSAAAPGEYRGGVRSANALSSSASVRRDPVQQHGFVGAGQPPGHDALHHAEVTHDVSCCPVRAQRTALPLRAVQAREKLGLDGVVALLERIARARGRSRHPLQIQRSMTEHGQVAESPPGSSGGAVPGSIAVYRAPVHCGRRRGRCPRPRLCSCRSRSNRPGGRPVPDLEEAPLACSTGKLLVGTRPSMIMRSARSSFRAFHSFVSLRSLARGTHARRVPE